MAFLFTFERKKTTSANVPAQCGSKDFNILRRGLLMTTEFQIFDYENGARVHFGVRTKSVEASATIAARLVTVFSRKQR